MKAKISGKSVVQVTTLAAERALVRVTMIVVRVTAPPPATTVVRVTMMVVRVTAPPAAMAAVRLVQFFNSFLTDLLVHW